MIRCLHCDAETSNGLALCELCRRLAEEVLGMLPIYVRNLARWRPSTAASDRKRTKGQSLLDTMVSVLESGQTRAIARPSSFAAGAPSDHRIPDRLDDAMTALTTWARAFADDRPNHPRPLTWPDAVLLADLPDATAERLVDDKATAAAALCAGFDRHLTSISTLDWCGEFLRDLAGHESVLRGLTETYVPGWYAGACQRCEAATYVVPGLTWVTCGTCGTTTYARDHLEVVLAEARDWVAPPRRLAEALVALVDTEQSVPRLYERIHKWGQRGRITPVRRVTRVHAFDLDLERIVVREDHVGPARYRFGEVLDALAREGATRTTRRIAAVGDGQC